MALRLPTDTQHLQFETRQYELFNRPLGQGIARRKIAVAVAACVVWFLVMILFGVNPLSRFGPTLYALPPFAFVFYGTRTGDDGRMNLILWYDALLVRLPNRRKVIRNPLMDVGDYAPSTIVLTVTTELRPRTPGESLTPLTSYRHGEGEK